MSVRRNEGGGAGIKALIFVIILFYAIYCGIVVGGAKSSDALIQKKSEEFMKFAAVNKDDPTTLQYKLGKLAKDENIPIKPEEIEVTDEGNEWHIRFAYKRDIPLVFWNYKYPVAFDKRAPKG